MIENEIKFKLKDHKKLKNLLIKIGAKQYPEVKEIDYSFDTKDAIFSKHRKLLRLRKINRGALFTLKGPIMRACFKKRREINIKLEDFERAKQLLGEIGFICSFSKEKIRQKFSYKSLEICLDKLPFIGHYVEIEGKNREIFKFIKKIGFNMKDAIKDSYEGLFGLFCIINECDISRIMNKFEFSFHSEKQWIKNKRK